MNSQQLFQMMVQQGMSPEEAMQRVQDMAQPQQQAPPQQPMLPGGPQNMGQEVPPAPISREASARAANPVDITGVQGMMQGAYDAAQALGQGNVAGALPAAAGMIPGPAGAIARKLGKKSPYDQMMDEIGWSGNQPKSPYDQLMEETAEGQKGWRAQEQWRAQAMKNNIDEGPSPNAMDAQRNTYAGLLPRRKTKRAGEGVEVGRPPTGPKALTDMAAFRALQRELMKNMLGPGK